MSKRIFSVLGLFDDAQRMMDAIPIIKAGAQARLEAYTPYPVHGLAKALGQRKSPVAGMVFIMGILGAIAGVGLQLWTSGIDYPLTTAGKPYFSWEAFIPIMFEVTVLFATFTAGLGMLLLLNRLPFFRHPMLRAKSMPLITRDHFALALESDGEELEVAALSVLLKQAGAKSIEVIAPPEAPGPISPLFFMRAAVMILIACLVSGTLTYWGIKLFPVIVPIVHMLDQPRQDPQRTNPFFKDESGMRLPVAGTVARGHIPYLIKDQDQAAILANPLPVTEPVLKQGRRLFSVTCSVCHGALGDGVSSLTAAYGAKPTHLSAPAIREYPDGKIYHAIVMGKNAMPAYADLSEDQRWAVVHYVRALQRALNAKESDMSKEERR